MKIEGEKVQILEGKIEKAKKILLLCHAKPDGDAIGSTLAVHSALDKMGKDVTSCSIDPVGMRYYFLPMIYNMREHFGSLDSYDLIIILDCGDRSMTGFQKEFPDMFSGKYNIINIDHHISNDDFGNLNIVIPTAASTSHILYYLFKEMKIEITPEIATLLMAGLYYDTGSFRHDNTTAEVLMVASVLLKYGAKADKIAKYMFRSNSIATLKLWGRVFDKMKKNKNHIISSILSEDDIKECNVDSNNLHLTEAMNYLDSVPGAKFSVLLTELDGNIKGSFRTSSNTIDVSKIAKVFNGGGHRKAAGFVMKGRVSDIDGQWRSIIGK